MAPVDTYKIWLDHLRVLYPIEGLLHVGVRTSEPLDLYSKWHVPSLVLIEADEDRVEAVSEAVSEIDGWKVHNELLAAKGGELVFYRASNPNESGLLVPEELSPLWQNLTTIQEQSLQAITIENLFASSNKDTEAVSVNWACIDCLPSLPIIKGAGALLDKWDVVLARTLVDESLAQGRGDLGKSALDAFMASHGFECIAHEPERHPAISQVSYVRNWKKTLLSELGSKVEEQRNQWDFFNTQITRITTSRDEQKKLANERAAQITRITASRDEQQKLADERSSEIDKLIQAHDEQKNLADERATEIVRLTEVHNEQKKQNDDGSNNDAGQKHLQLKGTRNKIIFVLGMHRSGTSVVARGLVALGYKVGASLVPPAPDNPKGFWEDKDIVKFNNRLLSSMGLNFRSIALFDEDSHSAFDNAERREFAKEARNLLVSKLNKNSRLVIKDPRLCRLLWFWLPIVDELGIDTSFAIAVRHPLSVTKSLLLRDKMSRNRVLILWLQHIIMAVQATHNRTRTFVCYESIMNDAGKQMERVASQLNISMSKRRAKEMDVYAYEYIDGSLCNSEYTLKNLKQQQDILPVAVRAYSLLLKSCKDVYQPNSSKLINAWNNIEQEFDQIQSLLSVINEFEMKYEASCVKE